MNFTVFMPMRTNRMKYVGIVLALLLGTFSGRAADSTGRKLVYTFPIREDIMPSVERLTGKCLAQADEMGADLVVIQMNTYGGVVSAADSIRTMLLNSRIPVWVWIDMSGGGICHPARSYGHHARPVQCGLRFHGAAPRKTGKDDHLRGRLPV